MGQLQLHASIYRQLSMTEMESNEDISKKKKKAYQHIIQKSSKSWLLNELCCFLAVDLHS